jgi:23S rRNA pseudouridine1911/1915/1917 synthase
MIEDEVLEPESDEEEELFEHHKFKADPGQEVIRIDKYLIDRLSKYSRNKIQVAAKNGNIHVNGKPVKQNYKVKPGDSVAIVLPYPVREVKLIPQNIPIEICYEDEDLLVVNKPTNMVVHPGYGNYKDTLVNALVYHFDNLPKPPKDYFGRPGLVHRIDKNTSGLLVIAKTELALTDLAQQFFERSTDRLYYALVWGDVKADGTITGNLARSLKNRKVMAVFPDSEYGKHAVTHYKVIERFGNVTLVQCKLETGRTHQIRVHFQYIGHPLFNDPEYGGDKIVKGTTTANYKKFVENCMSLVPGQALHAKSLGFTQPTTKERLHFETELTPGFQELLKKWRAWSTDKLTESP